MHASMVLGRDNQVGLDEPGRWLDELHHPAAAGERDVRAAVRLGESGRSGCRPGRHPLRCADWSAWAGGTVPRLTRFGGDILPAEALREAGAGPGRAHPGSMARSAGLTREGHRERGREVPGRLLTELLR